MKLPTFGITAAIAICTAASAAAGGGACRFQADGLPLLKQSPVLAEMITSKFVVQDGGRMGPTDAPFHGRRLYSYMEFSASAPGERTQGFTIRIHFGRSPGGADFERVEVLPVRNSPEGH